jgi:alpha-1,3-rhamnosyltransferase
MESPQQEKRGQVFVVVPSYNHAPFVERCLLSIIGQTSQPKKLLVIDDGSTDGSQRIIEQVLRDFPFDRELIARENRGLSATLNEAFALSGGEFFAYLGSDDIWLPNFLEEQTRLLHSRQSARLAFSHAYVIDEQDRIIDTTANWAEFADGDLLPTLLRGDVFSSPGVLYRRSALEGHRWNEQAKLEDYEMYLKLSREGEFARNTEILCAWRVHGMNESKNLPVMFPEMLAAQQRLAPVLRLDRDELDRIQTRMKFAAVENFVRHGYRHEARKLFAQNVRGATSASHLLNTALRLAVPEALFTWNRRRKLRNAVGRFGTLDAAMKRKDD